MKLVDIVYLLLAISGFVFGFWLRSGTIPSSQAMLVGGMVIGLLYKPYMKLVKRD